MIKRHNPSRYISFILYEMKVLLCMLLIIRFNRWKNEVLSTHYLSDGFIGFFGGYAPPTDVCGIILPASAADFSYV